MGTYTDCHAVKMIKSGDVEYEKMVTNGDVHGLSRGQNDKGGKWGRTRIVTRSSEPWCQVQWFFL